MNLYRIILILVCGIILSSLAGCGSASSTSNLWIVFPERRAEEIGIGSWISSGADFDGYWTPAEEDILNLEGKLDSFLRENSEKFNRQPPVGEGLNDYMRQYVGAVIRGKRIVHGNFFCTDTGVDWKEEWVFVLDGGDCFFQLQFDVGSGTFIELTVNGEA